MIAGSEQAVSGQRAGSERAASRLRAVRFYKALTKPANFPAGKVIKCNRQKVIAAFAGLQEPSWILYERVTTEERSIGI